MALVWDPAAVLNVASGVLMGGLGLALLAAEPRRDWNRLFGFLALLWGAQIVTANAVRLTTTPSTAVLAGKLTLAFLIPLYFFLVAFVAVFPRPRAPFGTSTAAVALLALPAVAALAVLFLRPESLIADVAARPDGSLTLNWGGLMPYLVTAPFFGALSYALFVMMRRFEEAVSPTERKQVGAVLAALGLYVGYYAPSQLVAFGGQALGLGTAPEAAGAEAALIALIMAVTVAILAAVVVLLARRLRELSPGPAHGQARAILGVVGVGVLGALLVEGLARTGGPRLELVGLFRTGSVLLIVYAIARYQLFDLELRAKRWTSAAGAILAVAAGAAVAYLILGGVGLAPGPSGALAGLVALLGLAPAFHLAYRLADRVAPEVTATGDHLYLRKLEVYRAALERRLAEDAPIDPALVELEVLRERLGLDAEDHSVVATLAEADPDPLHADEDREAALSGYELEGVIDQGAYGRVLMARELDTGRPVVVKELLDRWRHDDVVAERFLREARIAGRLDHPNVVAVHEVAEQAGNRYLVMEHVAGGSLAERLEDGPLSPEEAVRVARDVLAALSAAHEAGVVHRDVKPGNVLVTEDGRAKLTDFGIADLTRQAPEETRTGLTTGPRPPGTLAYMSPEQALGDPLDERSDLYSVGALLYRCLTGRAPVDVDGLDEVTARERVARAGPPDADEVPEDLAPVIRRAMTRDPDDRFADARAFLDALEELNLEARPVRGS